MNRYHVTLVVDSVDYEYDVSSTSIEGAELHAAIRYGATYGAISTHTTLGVKASQVLPDDVSTQKG